MVEVVDGLVAALCAQVRQVASFIPQLAASSFPDFNKFKAYHFCPMGYPHPVTIIYPIAIGDPDEYLTGVRRTLHVKLGLPMDKPLLRTSNALLMGGKSRSRLAAEIAPTRLRDVHKSCKPSGLEGGKMHLVSGSYDYYHYMQDNFNDSGWGCAYRSMQTLVSWLRLAGYTQAPIPTHAEIQRVLVELGDKPPSFVGSSEWIGAIEIQMCLSKLYGINCKVMALRSGADIAYKGAELAAHFDREGSPVMIGGGVLAYTLLGVDYNEETGEARFLILDPHYTGADSMKGIKDKWCAWRDAAVFKKEYFYNLCLPQRPRDV